MARYEYERDDDRGQYSRSRDEGDQVRRWSGGGNDEYREPERTVFRSSSPAQRSSSRPEHEGERSCDDWRRERTDQDSGHHDQDRDWRHEMSNRGWEPRRSDDWRNTGDRAGFGMSHETAPEGSRSRQGFGRHEGDWDWERNYGRTVDWNPRRARDRDSSWDERDFRSHDEWRGRPGGASIMGGSPTEAWTAGPFAGRGPRGYQRSDERIREDVCEVLTRHGQIDASDVDVDVRRGEVILRGMVDGRHMKRMIEDVVEDLPGVHDVRNEIRVRQGAYGSSGHTYATSQGSSYQSMGSQPGRFEHGLGQRQGASSGTMFGSDFRSQLREGMSVVGSDGDNVGELKEISSSSFLLDRSMHREIFVPYSAIQSVTGDRVMLSVRSNDIDDQGWATPDLMGSTSGDSRSQ